MALLPHCVITMIHIILYHYDLSPIMTRASEKPSGVERLLLSKFIGFGLIAILIVMAGMAS